MRIVFTLCLALLLGANDTMDQSFLELLDDAELYATETRLNIDDKPSTIEILRQKELRELGINTLSEALSLLVGVEISMNSAGQPIIVIRGVKSPDTFTLDKIKLFIDHVEISSLHNATIEYYLTFPVNLLSRIEILKSPGSAMYGSGAFLGVVNVVTSASQADENHVSFGLGSYDYAYSGFQFHTNEDDYHLSLDGYYMKNEKYLDAKGFAKYPERLGRAEESDEHLRDYSIGFNAQIGNLSLKSRIKRKRSGLFYDYGEVLYSGNNDEHLMREYFFAELGYTYEIKKNVKLKMSAGYSYHDGDFVLSEQMNDEQNLFYQLVLPGFGSDYYSYTHVKEESYVGKLEVNFRNIEKHNITLGGSYRHTANTTNILYLEPFTKEKYELFSVLNPNYPIIDGGFYEKPHPKRIESALYFQDLVALSQNIDLQLGFRLDRYTDELTQTSYNLGALYQHNDFWNSKLSYATGFRAPTWSELYRIGNGTDFLKGNPDLDPETIETYEYNLLYNQSPQRTVKMNLYYTNLHNTIDRTQDRVNYFNARNYSSKGFEISLREKLFSDDLLVVNYAYNDTRYFSQDGAYSQQTPEVAQHLANVYYIYRPNDDISLSFHYLFTGPREKNKIMVEPDERHKYDKDYPVNHQFNTTLMYRYDDWFETIFSIKNLFDSEIINPSSLNRHHETGLVREGRHFMIEATFLL